MAELAALTALVVPLIDRVQPQWKKNKRAQRDRFIEETTRTIADHHLAVVNWTGEVHDVGPGQFEPDAATIELIFRSQRRRLGVGGRELTEIDLLLDERNFAVLGDPGAGKTTTLRRLARNVAVSAEVADNDAFRFVVLVVCREEQWDKRSLYEILGTKIGIDDKVAADLDNVAVSINELLGTGALVIVDGLDEVPNRHRSQLEQELTRLGRSMADGKVIVSCRSGDYSQPIQGFAPAEILPLDEAQIRSFAEGFLGDDAEGFLEAIAGEDHPASDLTNRPLFLVQMMKVYKRRNSVPERPVDLYGSIVRLVLDDWDNERGIRRSSRYSQFDVDEKRRFLCDLAFDFSRRGLIRFDLDDLVESYRYLAGRYELPKDQARAVALELESHTGLLVESGEQYEFSHLSLQEYLAADSVIRSVPSDHPRWWDYYEVAAVSVALASDVNGWLDALVSLIPREPEDVRPLHGFLHRLGQESPRFEQDERLGHTMMTLLARSRVRDPEAVRALGRSKSLRQSLAEELNTYQHVRAVRGTTSAYDRGDRPDNFTRVVAVPTDVLIAVLGPDLHRACLTEA